MIKLTLHSASIYLTGLLIPIVIFRRLQMEKRTKIVLCLVTDLDVFSVPSLVTNETSIHKNLLLLRVQLDKY